MIFEDDIFYTLKPDTASKDQVFWHTWYNRMTDPLAVLGLIVACFALFRQTITTALSKSSDQGTSDTYLLFMLLALTFAIGWRLIQSLYWAKKDYSRLEFGLSDVLTLLVFIFFTTGISIILFADHPKAIVGVYACLCAVGFWHFRGLAKRRIPADARHYDLPIETRIQTVNAWVFGVLAVDFGATFALMVIADPMNRIWVSFALFPILPAVLVNIRHSHEMSDWPKTIINNKYLAPDKIAKRLEVLVGVDDEILERRGVVSALKTYKTSYRSLTVRRARKLDINLISRLYLRDLRYVLDGMFPNVDLSHENLIDKLLRSSFGLGFLGYLRFYILEVDGKSVGMFMPAFRSEPTLYNALDYVNFGRFLIRQVGVSGLRRVLHNLKALPALQPPPGLKELRINYIAITDDEQRKGNAGRVISLLQQAFIHSSTNGFRAHCITAFVRDANVSSIALFEKAGFKREEIDADPAEDPTRGAGSGLIRYVFSQGEFPRPTPRISAVKRRDARSKDYAATSSGLVGQATVDTLARVPAPEPALPPLKTTRSKRAANNDALPPSPPTES